MNLDRQIVELLSLDFEQLSKLKKFGNDKLTKAFRSTLKYAGNKPVYDRRKYFKECLKLYSSQASLPFKPYGEESKIDVQSFRQLHQDKPWAQS